MGYVRCDDRRARDQWARCLRDQGWPLRVVAATVGCSMETVREACDPELKARRNARRLARYHERQGARATFEQFDEAET